jgi:hypothetical protein
MNMTARKSPCFTCHGFGQPQYPECADDCRPLDDYLIVIGDKPLKKPDKNLHLLFPPEHRYKSQDVCTFAQVRYFS